MSAKDSSFVSMLITLVVVTGVAALSLGFVFKFTEEPIAAAKAAKQMRAIQGVVGDYDNDPLAESFIICKEGELFQKCETGDKTSLTFYPASIQSELSATGIQTYSEKGYSGRIEIIVGVDQEGVIKNIEVVSHAETPGLGSKMSSPKFKDQFIGWKLEDQPIKVKKDGGKVDAISGATISSRAFSDAVQLALEAYNQSEQ